MFLPAALLAAVLTLACSGTATGEATGAADNLRTGWYPDEPSLAPTSVTPSAFGQAFKTQLQGVIMGQPLVANGTLIAVTEDDMVYGLDPVTGAVRWARRFGTPVKYTELGSGSETCPDIKPNIGITSTPVIDTARNIAYFVADNSEPAEKDRSSWYMHAVDVASGEETTGFPVKLSGHAADNLTGVTLGGNHFLQRPALLMLEGVVYAAFGSHCDLPPYAGLVAGVSTSGQFRTLWASTKATEGSIWQSGSGLISDGPGQILLTTGNGTPSGEGDPGRGAGNQPVEGSLAESVVRLRVQPEGHLKATDFFSPYNNTELDKEDFDIGSAAPIALPPEYFGTPTDPNLLVQSGKKGEVYLLNRSNLGGMGQGAEGRDSVIEEKGLGEYGGVWDGLALWPGDGGYVYIPGVSKPGTGQENFNYLRYFSYGVTPAGVPKLTEAARTTEEFGFGSGSPIVTSSGTSAGSAVLWVTHCPNFDISHCEKNAELWAYDATPSGSVPRRLWTAPLGWASKFSRPGASAGHIYVGNTEGQLLGFSGRVLTPSTAAVEFGSVSAGAQQVAAVTFTNDGAPLNVTGVQAPPGPFALIGAPTPGAALAPGQSITVQVAFGPSAPGPYAGSFAISTQAGEARVSLSGSSPAPPPALTPGGSPPPSPTASASVLLASGLGGALGTGAGGGAGAGASSVVLDHLELRFLTVKSSSHRRRRATVTYTLSAAARVRMIVYRRLVSHHCVGAARTCVRYLPTAIRVTVSGRAGADALTLDLTTLARGDYRLSATPIVGPGAQATARRVAFAVG